MKQEYLNNFKKQYDEKVKKATSKHDSIKGSEIESFYNSILEYRFYGASDKSWKAGMSVSIYSFLKTAIECNGTDLDFVLSLQSFLCNTVLDDSYFKINWVKLYVDPNDRFNIDLNKYVNCDKDDPRAHPELHWAGDEDKDGCQDIELLEEALAIMIVNEKANVEKYQKFQNMKIK